MIRTMNNIFEQLLFTTALVECLDQQGTPSCIGTGFFLERQLGDGAYKIFLVSNRHVLHAGVDTIKLWLTRAKDGRPLVGQCEHILIERVGRMVMHPEVDLAVLDCTALFARFPGSLYFKAIPYESLADFEEPELSVAAPVFFVGYPEAISDTQNNLPLIRKGIISSHPGFDFDGFPQVIIDAQVYPGSSGSPAFVSLGNACQTPGNVSTFKLLGVVTATYLKNLRPIGLGIVIKATCLKQLIDDIS
jgi:hypothetical protein